ncbi:protease, ATP-dependent zinc-metallo [Haemophilus influenzae]|uniref:Protease, ATP-dependent zinc-metallo n=1 Tax=Haemophilus influenzae TaxID=727 RepID=A0A2X1RVW1_HAEIF|nr:protease, ATP-dependent zinc-metallo [Haemophilus influenzae]
MPPLEDKKLLDDLLSKKVKVEGTPFERRGFFIPNFNFLVPNVYSLLVYGYSLCVKCKAVAAKR